MEKETELITILKGENIRTVYQPIVSLDEGTIFGYEALSRIELKECDFNIEELFNIAREERKLWELEKLCRTKALKNAINKPGKAKLFINVDPNIIHDSKLKSGFTKEKLHEFGLDVEDIIFEVTEKSAINTMKVFKASIEHYQSQNFKIAVDDFGSGYSGLSQICNFSPNFIKIDMELVRNINEDFVKKSIVGAIVQFCKDAEIKVIAEGIETREELKTLMSIGVAYGQGYFFAKPAGEFYEMEEEKKALIRQEKDKTRLLYKPSVFDKIHYISKVKKIVNFSEKAVYVYNMMQNDPEITEVCVVDNNKKVCGLLTRSYVIERFSGQFGYNLSQRRTAKELMKINFLSVERDKSIDEVAKIAMERNVSDIYEAIIVTDNHKYVGVVTVKDLLTTAIELQVKRATEANPLTGLPGNTVIQEKIYDIIKSLGEFSIIYLDLDNFKAYNDAYGFTNGDIMIRLLAESIKSCCKERDFKGHIGGDDFVIITQNLDANNLSRKIIVDFRNSIKTLYSEEDWEQGYIVSKNRNGFTERFPIATLSIAAVTNKENQYSNIEELSKVIAEIKKRQNRS